MNKSALVGVIVSKTGLTKTAARQAVEEAMAAIVTAVSGGDVVRLSGFGTFEARERGPRTARNPRTNEEVRLEAATVPAFRASPAFKLAVAKGDA